MQKSLLSRPYINVTPLVDVVLVLLIIFMVLLPKMAEQIPVSLPGVFNPDPKAKLSYEPISVKITVDGHYYVKDKPYSSLDTLISHLKSVRQKTPSRRLILKADSSLTFGKIRPLLDKAQFLGFKGIGFAVGQKHKKGEK